MKVGISVLVFLVALAGFAQESRAQAGLTFVVNSTADTGDSSLGDSICASSGGACTLRAAIQESNALAGRQNINFAIGSGVQTIGITSNLPSVSDPVTIDATTQPGFAGAPLIVVNGNGSKGHLTITSGNTILRGVAIVGFAGDGLEIRTGGGNTIEACYIGLGADGITAVPNTGSGLLIDNSSNNRIGGPNKSQRNVISGNTGKGNGGGILMTNGTNNIIQGNFIGVDVSGMFERPNEGRGIALSSSTGNLIGGPEAGAGNLIAGNRATGVRLLGGSHNNTVQANFLGVNKTVTGFLANDRGVQIRGSNGNQVLGNLIAGHVYDGILIWEGSSNNGVSGNVIAYNGQGPVGDPTEAAYNGVLVITGTGNMIVSNSIYGNGVLGIQLGTPLGVTPNDTGDDDTGGNNLQNYPVVTSALVAGTTTAVGGTLNSKASSLFLIQFFADAACDPRGHGEGRYFLGQTTVTTSATGNATFQATLASQIPAGWIVTATATDTGGNTSEFSACATVR